MINSLVLYAKVTGVINMCEEYRGPTKNYDELGMEELWLRTVDHFEPSLEHLKVGLFSHPFRISAIDYSYHHI